MASDALRQRLRANPFQPFRVFLASGTSYLIASREWMLVTALTTAIGVPGEAGDGDRLILLDNMSITEAQPAGAPSAAC
jgi:hypothetical protein